MGNARKQAYQILDRVIRHGAYASILLRQQKNLSIRDQALVSEIVYGTLRNLMLLEYQWQPFVHTHVKPTLSVLLSMSVYQLQYMRAPSYAVINEAVEMAHGKEKGFVNAVLHQVLAQGKREIEEEDPLQKTALLTSHPEWLLKMWKAQYGEGAMQKIAQADQQPSAVYARINSLKIDPVSFAKEHSLVILENHCFQVTDMSMMKSYLNNGMIVIQDRASQRIPYMLDVKAGMDVLDACSAPGTKAQETACFMNNTGRITACDLYGDRTELIRELAKRTGAFCMHAIVQDAVKYRMDWKEKFDRVLIDAPCSGLGDLSHKPEIRFHVTPESLDEISMTQKAILENNVHYLKEGGIIVYSTCTLNKKENEKQISSFLQIHPEMKLLEEHTYFPYELNSDGFYFAKMKKIGEDQ